MAVKTKPIEIYLGKANKIYGPFSLSELDQMATEGKLATFVWIWDHDGEQWKPLESPPPAPTTLKVPSPSPDESTNSALCYDQFSTVCGALNGITETGCLLLSSHLGAGPKFVIGGQVAVNIIDSKKKNSKKSTAQVISITRVQEQWAYRLRWLARD